MKTICNYDAHFELHFSPNNSNKCLCMPNPAYNTDITNLTDLKRTIVELMCKIVANIMAIAICQCREIQCIQLED